MAALILEYRTQIGGVPDAAVKAGGERMASRRILEGDKWVLGETGEEVVSWGDRFGVPFHVRYCKVSHPVTLVPRVSPFHLRYCKVIRLPLFHGYHWAFRVVPL